MESLDVCYEKKKSTDSEDTSSKTGALMYALNSVISQQDLKKKSNLTDENVKGLQKLFILNDYLEQSYGARIPELDKFAIDKLNTIMSLNSKGFDALIDAIKSLAISLEHNEFPERNESRGSLRSN
jgi:hypothetical protein